MRIVLTGSLGNIGRPLTETLAAKGHAVTVISSRESRRADIEALGATAAVGTMQDAGFLTQTFTGADIVYLMETMEAVGDIFDPSVDFIGAITRIGENYKQAVERSGVKRIIHLSSVGAHTDRGMGILRFHHNVEGLLRQLPEDVSIKTIRPGCFYLNLFSSLHTIKTQGAIVSNYGGDTKEPWVSPKDIAAVIAGEMDQPFAGRTVRYVVSDEISPNEIAAALGAAIGQPGLQWKVIPGEDLLRGWLDAGFNPQVAEGFIEMQQSQGDGSIYADYHRHRPAPGRVKLADFAREFAEVYNQVTP